MERGRDVLGHPLEADPLGEAAQGARQVRVLADVDLLAVCEARLHLLSDDGRGGEPSQELQAGLAQAVRPALVASNGRADVVVAAGHGRSAVHARQGLLAVSHSSAVARRAHFDAEVGVGRTPGGMGVNQHRMVGDVWSHVWYLGVSIARNQTRRLIFVSF